MLNAHTRNILGLLAPRVFVRLLEKPKYYSVAATAQWFLEGSLKYGTKGFKNAAASFAPRDLDVVSGA